jgi:hypothetical protein
MEHEEIQAIAEAVGKAVVVALGPKREPITDVNDVPEGAFFDEQTQEVIYTDLAVKAADEAEMDCLKTLPKGVIHVKGRRGTTTINQSAESLDAIANWKKNRNQYRTRTNS